MRVGFASSNGRLDKHCVPSLVHVPLLQAVLASQNAQDVYHNPTKTFPSLLFWVFTSQARVRMRTTMLWLEQRLCPCSAPSRESPAIFCSSR